MAELSKTLISFSDLSGALDFSAASGSDYFICDNADQRMILIAENKNTQNAALTLKAGDGELGLLGDAVFSIAGGTTRAVPLSRVGSSRIKVLGGADSGKVFVAAAVDAGGAVGSVNLAVLSIE